MSEGTEAAPVAPAPAALNPDIINAGLAPAPTAEPEALVLGGYSPQFMELAKQWIDARIGDSRDKNPKVRFGITRELLGDFLARKSPATADELAGITEELAYKILHDRVWGPIEGDKLGVIAKAVWDIAIRRNVERAVKTVQKSIPGLVPVALKADGRNGKQTLTAIGEIIAQGQAIALAEQVMLHRDRFVFRLFDGKLFGGNIDVVRAGMMIGKVYAASKGIRLP